MVLVKFDRIIMLQMKIALVSLVLFTSAGMKLLDGDLERISLAMQTGNSKEMAKYFDNTVEINEESYSKAQAEMVLKDFFTKNKPASFKMIHNGSSQGSQYGIGMLITDKGTYRTYIYLKPKGTSLFIQSISFEKE